MDIILIAILMEAMLFIFLAAKKKDLGPGILYFILALGITCATKFGAYVILGSESADAVRFYVVGILFFAFLFLFLFYYHVLEKTVLRRVQLMVIFLFLLNFIISGLLDPDFFTIFPTITFLVDDVLLMFSIGLYVFETFNSDKILELRHYYAFWISIGLIVIYFGILPMMLISFQTEVIISAKDFQWILIFINFVGYMIMVIGTFFTKNNRWT